MVIIIMNNPIASSVQLITYCVWRLGAKAVSRGDMDFSLDSLSSEIEFKVGGLFAYFEL